MMRRKPIQGKPHTFIAVGTLKNLYSASLLVGTSFRLGICRFLDPLCWVSKSGKL